MLASIVATLVVVLGVPVRFKYVWTGTKIRRRKSAKDVSRKFYITSWVIYVLQVIHNLYQQDYVDVVFWTVGVFTVAYAIHSCFIFREDDSSFGRWLIDSFRGEEEGGLWR